MFRFFGIILTVYSIALTSPVQFLTIDSVDITHRDEFIYIHATIDNYDGGLFKDSRYKSWNRSKKREKNDELYLDLGLQHKIRPINRYYHKVTMRFPFIFEPVNDTLRINISFGAEFSGMWGCHYLGIIHTPESTFACQGFGDSYHWSSPLKVLTMNQNKVTLVNDTVTYTWDKSPFISAVNGTLFSPEDSNVEWYYYNMRHLMNSQYRKEVQITAPTSSQRKLKKALEPLVSDFYSEDRFKTSTPLHINDTTSLIYDTIQWSVVLSLTEKEFNENSRYAATPFFLSTDSAKTLYESERYKISAMIHPHSPQIKDNQGTVVPAQSVLYLEKRSTTDSLKHYQLLTATEGTVKPILIYEHEERLTLYLEEQNLNSTQHEQSSKVIRCYEYIDDKLSTEQLLSISAADRKQITYLPLERVGFSIVVTEGLVPVQTKTVLYAN